MSATIVLIVLSKRSFPPLLSVFYLYSLSRPCPHALAYLMHTYAGFLFDFSSTPVVAVNSSSAWTSIIQPHSLWCDAGKEPSPFKSFKIFQAHSKKFLVEVCFDSYTGAPCCCCSCLSLTQGMRPWPLDWVKVKSTKVCGGSILQQPSIETQDNLVMIPKTPASLTLPALQYAGFHLQPGEVAKQQ